MSPLNQSINRFAVPALLLLGLLTFAGALRVGFLWDDHVMIETNRFIQSVSLGNIQHIFTHDIFEGKGDNYYRPLQALLNMVDYQIWGLRPFGYHLTNLLLHLLNVCLLFYVLKLLLKDSTLSFLAASFFAVHPIIVEQELIIAGRAELMAVAFTLAGLMTLRHKSFRSDLLCALFYIGACLSKESGILLPFFLVGIGWFNPKFKPSWRVLTLLGAIGVGYLVLRRYVVPLSGMQLTAIQVLNFLVKELPSIVTTYVRILILPIDLHSHRRMVFGDIYVLFSGFTLLATLGWLSWRRSKYLWFCCGWFLIPLLPKIPLLATNALMLDHWAYLSGVGVYLLLAMGLTQLFEYRPWGRKTAFVLWSIILLFWSGISCWNITNRDTDEKMYRWALHHPTSSPLRSNLAGLLYLRGDYAEAKTLYEQSLRMNPSNGTAVSGLALVQWQQGDREEAHRLLSDWLNKNPADETGWAIEANLLYQEGNHLGSIQANETVLRINPNNQVAKRNLKFLQSVQNHGKK